MARVGVGSDYVQLAVHTLALVPLPGAEDLYALWREYEDASTPEGRLVKALDKLDMALQATIYEAQSLDLSEFVDSALARLDDPLLRTLAGGEPPPDAPA